MSDLNRIKQAMADGEHTDGDLEWCVDEIERLRKICDDAWQVIQNERKDLTRIEKEYDAKIKLLRDGCDRLHGYIADKDKKIERLRAALNYGSWQLSRSTGG